jgi:2-polyprenyl-6-methoxyphenol hydroxylase-like FAD-dependent oxidoreductase
MVLNDVDKSAVAIVGGGTAGCATALALSARGVRNVLVIDKQAQARWRIGESVPPATGPILQRLGVWEAFRAQQHLPSAGSCAGWGRAQLAYNDAILDKQGKGWHLDRPAFDSMLSEQAARRGARIADGYRFHDIERRDDGFVLDVQDPAGAHCRVATEFLVDATGIAAGAVRRLGVARNQIDCLVVIGTIVTLGKPKEVPSQALVEACEDGWWYAAKLPEGRMIVAMAVEPEQRGRYTQPEVWHAALAATRHVAGWLEKGRATVTIEQALETALAPTAILSCVVGEGWLAVGDAASSYDPIAAQGVLKALADGEAAAEAIAAYRSGQDRSFLRSYQDEIFARFRDYLRVREQLYLQEQRWPNAAFWRRRWFCQE